MGVPPRRTAALAAIAAWASLVLALVAPWSPSARAVDDALTPADQAEWEAVLTRGGLTAEAATQLMGSRPLVASGGDARFDPFAGPIPAGETGPRPAGFIIRQEFAHLVEFAPEQISTLRAGTLGCSEAGIVCQAERFRLDTPLPTTWLVSSMFLDRQIEVDGPNFTDVSLVIHDGRLGPVAPGRDQLVGGDPLEGGNRYFGIADAPGEAGLVARTAYWAPATATWTQTRSHGFAILDGTLLQLWWPTSSELFTFDGQRVYAGEAAAGQFAPGTTAFSSIPEVADGWTLVARGLEGLPLVGTDGAFVAGREPVAAPKPTPSPVPTATAAPSATPTATSAPTPGTSPTSAATSTPAPSAAPTAPGTPAFDLGSIAIPLGGLGAGLVLSIIGLVLLVRGRQPGPGGPGVAGQAIAVGAADPDLLVATAKGPCDDLAAALADADRACEEARLAAERARAVADSETARAAQARQRARDATSAREDAQRALDLELEAPDQGTSSISSGGLTLTEHDLRLIEDARVELAAAWEPRIRAAASDGERSAISERYRQEVLDLERAETIEALRAKAARARGDRIGAARARLAAAEDAERSALDEAADAEQAAQRARGTAHAAELQADHLCRQAQVIRGALEACLEREAAHPGGVQDDGGGRPSGGGGQPGGAPDPGPDGGGPGGGGVDGPPAGPDPGPGGGGGPGGGETPPPSGGKPQRAECPDGAEQWRPIGTRAFRLLPRDARIEWKVFPMRSLFADWLAPRQVDDQGNEVEGPPSVSQRSMRMVKGDLATLFKDLDSTHASSGLRYDQELVIVVPFVNRQLRKEQHWLCQDGRWVATGVCRVVELGVTPAPQAYGRGRKDVTLKVVKEIYGDAMNGIADAAENERQMGHFERECP